jgi:hypothetical protein
MPGNSGANRQDNRQRGNAAQLLEKYKSLARDSQLAGDRVQTEYYLQYADHYFRILEESRSRYEDQQGQGQGQRRRRDEDDDEMDGDEEMSGEDNSQDEDDAEPVRQQQQQRPRRERFERSERTERTERPERAEPRRANGARRDEEPEGEERIALGVLPPAIGAPDEAQEEEAPKPRRRARKPRAESNDDEIAPAA